MFLVQKVMCLFVLSAVDFDIVVARGMTVTLFLGQCSLNMTESLWVVPGPNMPNMASGTTFVGMWDHGPNFCDSEKCMDSV